MGQTFRSAQRTWLDQRFLAAVLVTLCVLALQPLSAQARPTAAVSRPIPPLRQLVPGLLARQLFTGVGRGGLQIELWDFVIGPGQRSDSTRLMGAAVLEIRGGTGQIAIDGKPQDLRIGGTLPVAEGSYVVFRNGRDDHALSIRAVIARRPNR